jgi:RND family efflux transporter MFP subunit
MNACRPALSWVALLALLGFAACKRQEKPTDTTPKEAIPVRLYTVEMKSVEQTEEAIGTVRAKWHALLAAKITGRIVTLPVVIGDSVKKGDLMARLEAPEIQARLDQAEAILEQARKDWNRYQVLLKEAAATQAEFDAVESRYRAAEASRAETRSLVDEMELRAPFDGVVSSKMADVGDLAVPGKPLLGVEDPTALRLEAEIPAGLISSVRLQSALRVEVANLNSNLTGTVSEIAPTGDPSSRTILVKLDLPSTPGLHPGQFARVRIPSGEGPAVRAPASVVIRRGQLEMVFVSQEQEAKMRLVKTGKRDGQQVELLSGVEPGEKLIIHPPPGLMEGNRLKILP